MTFIYVVQSFYGKRDRSKEVHSQTRILCAGQNSGYSGSYQLSTVAPTGRERAIDISVSRHNDDNSSGIVRSMSLRLLL